MTPTPDARLIEAMAKALHAADGEALQHWTWKDYAPQVETALTAARTQGYALVPVGLLERAAETISPLEASRHLEDLADECLKATGRLPPFKDTSWGGRAMDRDDYRVWIQERDAELAARLRAAVGKGEAL